MSRRSKSFVAFNKIEGNVPEQTRMGIGRRAAEHNALIIDRLPTLNELLPLAFSGLDLEGWYQPKETTGLRDSLREYLVNSAQWGLTNSVVVWTFDKCETWGAVAYALPAILPFVRKVHDRVADYAEKNMAKDAWHIEDEYLKGVQFANQFLAASHLLPESKLSSYMSFSWGDNVEIAVDFWPHKFVPCFNR